MKQKALIISIRGTTLTKKERYLFLKERPWGVILFKRNLKSLKQIKNLTSKIKILTKNKKFPILIDEEGGSVSRLHDIIDNKISANLVGNLYKKDKILSLKILKHYISSLSKILFNLGININTIPVLDVLRFNTHKIIGNRSFSKDKKIVKILGIKTIQYLHLNKIAGVIKHIPGHGASTLDSHLKTPRVNLSLKELIKKDFFPFKSNNSLFAMTAHIVYSKIDNENVATFSKKIVSEIIRKKIGFNGIIISDDLSMKALKYDLITNAKKSFEAGCNIVLYCAGKYEETHKLIKEIPYIDKFTSKKTSEFYKFLR